MKYYWDTIDQCVPPETILEVLRRGGFVDVKRRALFGFLSEYSAAKTGGARARPSDAPRGRQRMANSRRVDAPQPVAAQEAEQATAVAGRRRRPAGQEPEVARDVALHRVRTAA